MTTFLPFKTIQDWSNTKNSIDFAYAVQTTHYLRNSNSPDDLVEAASITTLFLEHFQNEWGAKAVPFIRKIKARMYHLECHLPQDRRQGVQGLIHKINALIEHIEGFSTFNASEYRPPLPTDLMNIVGQYLGALSIRDQAILSTKGILKLNEVSQKDIDCFCAAFYSCSDETVSMTMIELFFKVHNTQNRIGFLKRTPESQLLVRKFFEKDVHNIRWNGLLLPEKFPSNALLKFTKASSVERDGGLDPKDIHALMELPNITGFTNNDLTNKLKERQYKIIFKNRNLRSLQIKSGQGLNEKAFLGAYNPNLLALYLNNCPQLDIGILPQLSKSFPSVRVFHFSLRNTKKQLQHLDALEKFSSLEHLSYRATVFESKDLVVKISTLTLPNLKHLAFYSWDRDLEMPAFDKGRFPNLKESFFESNPYGNCYEDYNKAKLALNAPEAIESKEDEDSKEDIKNT